MEVWNRREIPKPPELTILYSNKDLSKKSIGESLHAVMFCVKKCNFAINNKYVQTCWTREIHMLNALLYQTARLRKDKLHKILKKLNRCLRRWTDLQLKEYMSVIMAMTPEYSRYNMRVPSRQMYEYLLLRVIGGFHLLLCIERYCREAATCLLIKMKTGHFISAATVFMAVVARIRILSVDIAGQLAIFCDAISPRIEHLKGNEGASLIVKSDVPKSFLKTLKKYCSDIEETAESNMRDINDSNEIYKLIGIFKNQGSTKKTSKVNEETVTTGVDTMHQNKQGKYTKMNKSETDDLSRTALRMLLDMSKEGDDKLSSSFLQEEDVPDYEDDFSARLGLMHHEEDVGISACDAYETDLGVLANDLDESDIEDETNESVLADETNVSALENETDVHVLVDETDVSNLADDTDESVMAEETNVNAMENETDVNILADETNESVIADETNANVLEDETDVLPDKTDVSIVADDTNVSILADETDVSVLAEETQTHKSNTAVSGTKQKRKKKKNMQSIESPETLKTPKRNFTQLSDTANIGNIKKPKKRKWDDENSSKVQNIKRAHKQFSTETFTCTDIRQNELAEKGETTAKKLNNDEIGQEAKTNIGQKKKNKRKRKSSPFMKVANNLEPQEGISTQQLPNITADIRDRESPKKKKRLNDHTIQERLVVLRKPIEKMAQKRKRKNKGKKNTWSIEVVH